MKDVFKKRVLIFLIAFILCAGGLCMAQEDASKYPTRPITCIIPFSPGGSADLAIRLLSKELEKNLGQPIVVVNKPAPEFCKLQDSWRCFPGVALVATHLYGAELPSQRYR